MDEILSATVDSRNGIVLDPRTKLFMLITITTLMFSTSNDGIMNIVKPILSLIPFALILSEHKFKTAGKYAVLYAVCFVLERLALNVWSGMISFLVLAATSIMTRFAPGIMTGAYLMQVSYDQVIGYDTQISKLQEEYNRYYSLKASLGDDLKEGLISKEEFDDFRESYGRKCEELEQMIENQKKLVKQMFEGGVSATVQLEDWKKSLEIKELDRTLLALTVDKIYIYENKQIKIHIRYQDMIEKMKVIRRFYAEHRTECRKEVG